MKHGEGHSHGYDKLKASKTLGEILDTAIGFEATARDFYTALAQRVNNPLKGLVEELAAEESRHYQLFVDLKARDDLQEQIEKRVNTPANDHKFADFVKMPTLDEHPDDQSVIQYAMAREHAAMEQYRDLAEETPEGPIRDLFAWLSKEELEHKAELEKQYYQMVYATNV
jgi:rubrerythrin